MECTESGKRINDHRKRPKIDTFGYFNLFVDNEPVVFSDPKEKEMLACLVEHNGGAVRENDIKNCLFEGTCSEPSQQSIFRRTKKNLYQTCQRYGIEHILMSKNHSMSILRNRVDCDFFAFNDWDEATIFHYSGQFMREFSWAETMQTDMDRRQMRYFLLKLEDFVGAQGVAEFLEITGFDPYGDHGANQDGNLKDK